LVCAVASLSTGPTEPVVILCSFDWGVHDKSTAKRNSLNSGVFKVNLMPVKMFLRKIAFCLPDQGKFIGSESIAKIWIFKGLYDIQLKEILS
jgi:hypothetical protein